jgi:hypothetical protein
LTVGDDDDEKSVSLGIFLELNIIQNDIFHRITIKLIDRGFIERIVDIFREAGQRSCESMKRKGHIVHFLGTVNPALLSLLVLYSDIAHEKRI